MAAEPRVIVHDAEQHGLLPLAARQHDAAPGDMEVEVPERMHVRDLERPPLARHEAFFELVAPGSAALAQTVMLHVTANRGVAGQLAKRRILPPNHQQIVVDEAVAPTRMVTAQTPNLFRHGFRHARMRASVLGYLALQSADRILCVARRVEPALDGFGTEPHHLARGGVAKGFRRQLGDAGGELARLGRRRQELADDLKA